MSRSDPDLLRTSFWSGGANYFRFPPGPLDALLTGQAAANDRTQRTQLVGQAQQLTTTLGVGPAAHDIAFDASSRIQLHDTWRSR